MSMLSCRTRSGIHATIGTISLHHGLRVEPAMTNL
jgi:hypothetical protein